MACVKSVLGANRAAAAAALSRSIILSYFAPENRRQHSQPATLVVKPPDPAPRSRVRRRATLDPVALVRIDDRDHANATAFTVRPAPRECHESAALASHFVEVTTDVLDPRDPVAHQDLVRRLPQRKVVENVPPGLSFIFGVEVRHGRTH